MSPTGTALHYVAAASGAEQHVPLPMATDTRYRHAHVAQEKPKPFDWAEHQADPDAPSVRCRLCRAIPAEGLTDELCPNCHNTAVTPPCPKPPTEGKQGKPTTGTSAPGATPTSSTTGRAPVAGPSTHQEKNPAATQETRPDVAAGLPAYAIDIAQLMATTEGHPNPAVRAARKTVVAALQGLNRIHTTAEQGTRHAHQLDQDLGAVENRGGRRPGQNNAKRAAERVAALGVTARDVRIWAHDNGHQVPDRGALSMRVIDAYATAHPSINTKENPAR